MVISNEYKIISVNSAKSLDVEAGDTNLFSNLIQYDYKEGRFI